jgi:zinc protease
MKNRFLPLAAAAALVGFCSVVVAAEKAVPPAKPKPAAAAPTPVPAGLEKVTSVEGITEYRLKSNGMRLLLFPDRSKQTATVNITYLVGSAHEGYGETGMAHLLEHLEFKGTPKHPNVPQELTAHGARPNGTTWFDRTNYFETFAATEENLAWALDLEADRMVNSFIAKKDLDSEMTVVRNEFEIGENSPDAVLTDRMMSTAFLWHNYGNSTIGARSDIENVPIENLQGFYRKWYQPDNAILVVAGKFDEAKTLALVAEKFGEIPRPKRDLPKVWTAEPAQDGARSVTLRRVGDSQIASLVYHVPAGSHPDFAAVDLLAYLLGDEPSGRLYKALVETKKASSVSVSAWQLRDPGVLIATANLRVDQNLEEAQKILVDTIEGFVKTPPSAEEVERARKSRQKDWDIMMRSSERAAIELSEWSSMGDWRLLFVHRDRLEKTSAADVARVATAFLVPANRTAGLFFPTKESERAEVPAAPAVATLVDGYTGKKELDAGEEFDPAPAAIEARVIRKKLGVGTKLVLLPKKTRGGTVQVSINLHLGGEASLQGRRIAGELAGSMLMRGTKKHTRQQIQDAIDALGARMMIDGSPTVAFANIEVPGRNLAEALRLAAEILREPVFPAAELELLRQEELARIEESKQDPQQLAATAIARHMNPWPSSDPRYVTTPEEAIEGIRAAKLAEVASFWKDFYGAKAGEIAVVGDFDPKATEKLLGELFAGFVAPKPFARLVNPFRSPAPLDSKVEAPDKESAVFRSSLAIQMRDDDPDYPALVLGNFLFGGGFLNSRLAVRIRQKEGLSYGVGAFFRASSFDREASMGGYAIYAPQNAERLESAFREEVARAVEKGFTAEEVAEGQKGWLQSRRVSRSQDRELAGQLGQRAFQDRTLSFDEKVEKTVQSLTAEQVSAAFRKWIDPSKVSIVQAGDFAKAAKVAAEGAKGEAKK